MQKLQTDSREKNITVVASYSKTVVLGKGPVIVGERINPTGKKKFKEALRNGDIDYILNEAFAQRDAGAHILDVNVGLPEIDECSTMEKAVKAISGRCKSSFTDRQLRPCNNRTCIAYLQRQTYGKLRKRQGRKHKSNYADSSKIRRCTCRTLS